jgi:GH24 family phage-related lysozyme (muramidase)
LVSFAFNIGGSQFGESRVVAFLRQGEYSKAADAIEVEFINADAPGLIERRKDEAALFRRPI